MANNLTLEEFLILWSQATGKNATPRIARNYLEGLHKLLLQELKLNGENINLDIESINIENNIKDYISKFLDSYIQTSNKDLVKEEFIDLYSISEKEK